MLAGLSALRRTAQHSDKLLAAASWSSQGFSGLIGSSGLQLQQHQPASQQQLLPLAGLRAASGGRPEVHSTTILCVRKGDMVVMIGDGQVSVGPVMVKPNVRKVRRIGDGVVAGFAGSAADGLSLLERLEVKLEEHPGQLLRAAVELAKQWRQDKALRFLQAELLVADASTTLTVSGNGDVLEPHNGVMAIGSGGNFATAAARALIDLPEMDAMTIAKKSMQIAADMCIYTNDTFTVESIKLDLPGAPGAAAGGEATHGSGAAGGSHYP